VNPAKTFDPVVRHVHQKDPTRAFGRLPTYDPFVADDSNLETERSNDLATITAVNHKEILYGISTVFLRYPD